MGSKSLIGALCMLGALTAVACNDDDGFDGSSGGDSGLSGTGGRASAGGGGRAGGGGAPGGGGGAPSGGGGGLTGGTGGINGGGAPSGGGGGLTGEAGMAGMPSGPDCTDFTTFVHTVIAQDTNAKAAPRPVNNIVFCPDPMPDPAAYNDLF